MSLGVNIALGLGSAVVFRWLSNTAFQATMPNVDPKMPMAGPVLGAVAVPGIPAGIAYAYKYKKTASVLAGMALGGAISTAEYISYAREAQTGPALPEAKSYSWIVVYKDGSIDTADSGTFDLAQVTAKDSEIANKYGGDTNVIMIVRRDAAGGTTVLGQKSAGFGEPKQLPQGIAVGEPMGRQSGAIVRTMMRRM